MRDPDRFEDRLRAALVDYTTGAPTGFDALAFAHDVSARAPRRRWHTAAVAWSPATTRLPWVAVLAALLLALIVGGVFIAGSPVIRRPAVVPPAGLHACPTDANPDEPGPADQARPPVASLFVPLTVDAAARQMVAVTDPGDAGGIQTWTFDLCTNIWTHASGSGTPGSGPTSIGAMAYDAQTGLVVGIEGDTGDAWIYDVGRDLWSDGANLDSALADANPLLVDERGGALAGVHPRLVDELGTDRVIAVWDGSVVRDDVFAYDVGDDAWTPIGSTGRVSSGPVVFDPQVGRLLIADFLDGALADPVRLMDPASGTVTVSSAASPRINYGWEPPNVADAAYDPIGRRMLVFNMGRMLAYDAVDDTWTTLEDVAAGTGKGDSSMGPRMRWRASIAWDPVNERIVVYGGSYQDVHPGADPGSEAAGSWVETDRVEAFDPVTVTWSTLLESSGDTPTP